MKSINRTLEPYIKEMIDRIFEEMQKNDRETYDKLVELMLEMDEARLKEDLKRIIKNQV